MIEPNAPEARSGPHLTLVIPTLNRYDRLNAMLRTVAASTVKPDQIIVIDNGQRLQSYLKNEIITACPKVNIYQPHSNLGVAGSCNQAMRFTRDWWFHCNDDVELAPDLIEKMTAAIIADDGGSPDTDRPLMYIPDYGAGSAFSVFMMHTAVGGLIGEWDESFFPIYFEDNDYGYRMNLAGVKRKVVEGCQYVHHTSSTIKGMSEAEQNAHHKNFRALRNYYMAKWGGPPEEERFSKPFDDQSIIEVDKTWWTRFGREAE